MPSSLYDRLGGEPAISAVVDLFYRKVIADCELRPFFKHVDMQGQRAKLSVLLLNVLGNDGSYSGAALRQAHLRMAPNLTDTHFNLVKDHLRSSLVELGVSGDLVRGVLAIVESTRADVLNQ